MNTNTSPLTREYIDEQKKALREQIKQLAIEEKKLPKPIFVDVNFQLLKSDKKLLDVKLKLEKKTQAEMFRLSVKNYLVDTVQTLTSSTENNTDLLKKLEEQEKALAQYKQIFANQVQMLVDDSHTPENAKNAILNGNIIIGLSS